MRLSEDRLAVLNEKFVEFIDKTGVDFIQENGQRKYGGPPPGWEGPEPPKGTEVHVSNLPQDCFEFELIPLFEKVGRIYETRLMMEHTSFNKGYCFIRFSTAAEAKKAIVVFHDYEIRPGQKISVTISVDNCRLFLGGIPNDKTKEDVMQLLSNNVTGLKDVILYKNVSNRKKNRGFCFLEFHNHRLAAIARRHMVPEKVGFWGRHLIVDWAEPEPDFIEDDELVKMTDLYVRNLSDDTDEEKLSNVVTKIAHPQYITRIKKVKDFAFIHFNSRSVAETVLKELDVCTVVQKAPTLEKQCSIHGILPIYRYGRSIDGEIVSVVWKRPSKESRENWLSRIKYNSRPKRNLVNQRLPDKHQLNELYKQQQEAITDSANLVSKSCETAKEGSTTVGTSKKSLRRDSNPGNTHHPDRRESHTANGYDDASHLVERRKKKLNKPFNIAIHNPTDICTPYPLNCMSPTLESSFSYLNIGSMANDYTYRTQESSRRTHDENCYRNPRNGVQNGLMFDLAPSPTPSPATPNSFMFPHNNYSRFQFPSSNSGPLCSTPDSSRNYLNLFMPASPSLNQQNGFAFPASPNPSQQQMLSLSQAHPMTYVNHSQPWSTD